MPSSRAATQEIRPLKVLVLNLMPKKIETENQFLRLLSNSPLQIDVQLLRIDSRESKNTPAEHLDNFYCNFEDIKDQNFDGLIVTGAPLGLVDFCDVAYWPQIEQIVHWAKEHVTSTLFVCWAVQAALNVLYGLPKLTRETKLSGVYHHQTLQPLALLTRGFDETFWHLILVTLIFLSMCFVNIPISIFWLNQNRPELICLRLKTSAWLLSQGIRNMMLTPYLVSISAMLLRG